ncbi:MAG: TraB/GumN family protein [Alphaproteobacteria bacterium]|nr:TraB/GumN family protein [Alphaproteobacteria bacterium]
MSSVFHRLSLTALLGSLLVGLLFWMAPAGPAAAKDQRLHGQGRLWQVTRGDIVPSHVFGTMHTSDEEVIKIPAAVRKAFVRSKRLIAEIELNHNIKVSLGEALHMTDGQSLHSIIGPKLFADLETVTRRYGLATHQVNQLHPWAVLLILQIPPAEIARQAEGYSVLDEVLQEYANSNGMPVYGLEQIDEQISPLKTMSRRDQIALLSSSIAMNGQINAHFKALKQAYLKGDLDAFHVMSRKVSPGTDPKTVSRFLKILIDDRNRHMADRAVPHLDAGGAFIAVGALHLSGKNGLLHLLEQKGYTVKRVN